MRRSPGRSASGFTLIELIVVIAIIGILAATALPRFMNMQQQARISKAQGLYGAVRSASTLAHAGCIANVGGTCTATGGSLIMEGAVVNMVNQYPAASPVTTSPGGIVLAAQLNSSADGVAISLSGSAVNIDIDGGTVPNCRIAYSEAPAVNTAPSITLNISAC